jgi:tetratricopeptide (TPR) repeat protein
LPKAEGHRLMGIHLDHLQTLGVRGPQIELLEAFWLVRGGKTAEASAKLAPLVNRLPLAAALRMDLNMGLARAEDARGDARAVRAHMQDRTRRGLTLNAQDWRSWYIAERLLGNTDQAETNARAWLKLEPKNVEAQRSLSELCQIRFTSLIATSDPDPEELAALFIEAAELTDNPHLLQRQVGQLYRQRDRIPVAAEVIERVARSPRTQGAILEAAGTAAAAEGNLEQARTYLEEAVGKDPTNSIAWNNYGYILTQLPNPDLDKALAAVNKALEVTPDEFHFRETRGQILVRLGKWREAIGDLEYAVNGMPTSREIHEALATAYEGIGDKQLARIHRDQAQ